MSAKEVPVTGLPYESEDEHLAKRPKIDYKPLTDDLPVRDFVKMMQYYRECPQVTVIVEDYSYTLSKSLLCAKSAFFDKAFNNGFLETTEQTMTLPEATTKIFELVIQWIYKGKLTFPINTQKTVLVEQLVGFFKLADALDICGPFDTIFKHLRAIIEERSDFLLPAHIRAAYELPKSHLLRGLVVAASVIRYIKCKRVGGDFMYQKEIDESAEYKMDLLEAVGETYKTTKGSNGYNTGIAVFSPLTGRWVEYK